MAIQTKIAGNFSSINIQKQIEDKAEEELRQIYRDTAKALIDYSPLGSLASTPNGKYATGAYISSHSVKFSSSSRGKGKSSRGRRKGSLNGSTSLSDMYSAIDSASFDQLQRVTFRNDSPHAQIVEYGPKMSPQWGRPGYRVYEKAAGKITR